MNLDKFLLCCCVTPVHQKVCRCASVPCFSLYSKVLLTNSKVINLFLIYLIY